MMTLNLMVSACWTGTEVENVVKTFKFLELTGSNMLAVTNLAICVNLALIVSVGCWVTFWMVVTLLCLAAYDWTCDYLSTFPFFFLLRRYPPPPSFPLSFSQ